MTLKYLKDIMYLSSKLVVRQVRFALAAVATVILVDIPFAVVTWIVLVFRSKLWHTLGGSRGKN